MSSGQSVIDDLTDVRYLVKDILSSDQSVIGDLRDFRYLGTKFKNKMLVTRTPYRDIAISFSNHGFTKVCHKGHITWGAKERKY